MVEPIIEKTAKILSPKPLLSLVLITFNIPYVITLRFLQIYFNLIVYKQRGRIFSSLRDYLNLK